MAQENALDGYVDNYDSYVAQKVQTVLALAKSKNSPVLVGAPGIGKSALIRAMGETEGRRVITVIGSRMDPTDVSGLPFPQKEEITDDEGETQSVHVTDFLTPAWQARILREKNVILFFDEFSNTPPAVQAALLTIFQEREFPNGTKIPDEAYIIAAMNPSDSAADYGGISKPTANRMAWISWNPTAESWYKGMMNAWGREDVSEVEMKWRRNVVSFVKQAPKFLHREPDMVNNQKNSQMSTYVDQEDSSEMTVFENAYPTRRTWDKLTEALPFANGESAVENQLMTSLVGFEAAAAFSDWIARQVKVDPEDVIKDPSIVPWDESAPDDVNTIIRALTQQVKPEVSLERFSAIMNVFDYIVDEAGRGDLAGFTIMDIAKSTPKGEKYKNRLLKTLKKYKNVVSRESRQEKSD